MRFSGKRNKERVILDDIGGCRISVYHDGELKSIERYDYTKQIDFRSLEYILCFSSRNIYTNKGSWFHFKDIDGIRKQYWWSKKYFCWGNYYD